MPESRSLASIELQGCKPHPQETSPWDLVDQQTFPGAACCKLIELPRDEAAPLQATLLPPASLSSRTIVAQVVKVLVVLSKTDRPGPRGDS
jgi:hypothetical protein